MPLQPPYAPGIMVDLSDAEKAQIQAEIDALKATWSLVDDEGNPMPQNTQAVVGEYNKTAAIKINGDTYEAYFV